MRELLYTIFLLCYYFTWKFRRLRRRYHLIIKEGPYGIKQEANAFKESCGLWNQWF